MYRQYLYNIIQKSQIGKSTYLKGLNLNPRFLGIHKKTLATRSQPFR